MNPIGEIVWHDLGPMYKSEVLMAVALFVDAVDRETADWWMEHGVICGQA